MILIGRLVGRNWLIATGTAALETPGGAGSSGDRAAWTNTGNHLSGSHVFPRAGPSCGDRIGLTVRRHYSGADEHHMQTVKQTVQQSSK
ncbi:hypothetical protein GCM10010390_34640 [Streptomyces mordarskii]|uniref:Secreted protein n=1 Tax=Streptomyces mordarskii TaxID=1226758 RepID=A0ABN1D021_9ACTN